MEKTNGITWSIRSSARHAFCAWISWFFQCSWSIIYPDNNGSYPFSCFSCWGGQHVHTGSCFGSFIPMPACRVFSMFAALAVLLDFLLQVTAFVALIVFDFLRAEDNRIDCFPCIKTSGSNAELEKGNSQQKPGLLVRYMKEIHAPILNIWGVKLLVVCAFGTFTLASIGYFNNVTEYLRIGPPLYFVVKDYNYSSELRQTNQLCLISQCDSNSLLNEISRASLVPESSYIAKPAASWLDDYLVWLSPEALGCCRKFTNASYCPPDDQLWTELGVQ
ncbi:Patched family protein [Perilla frutescens var. hirtella]|uniref:Patched family protein n=1 Tax=Perilla frutescens var. hirtella TaxID=608512 RepID=A0AAD4J641_PERFH|nr:Patched family protein [Perilla frutescens var. hirtella]